MSRADYGKTFALWREGAGTTWDDYTRHAFVQGLCDGTLPRAKFLHYLVQDYIFLIHFARAWSLAVVKAETLEEMKACARTVDALVNLEMSLHVTICAEEGISQSDLFNAAEDHENLAYTRYVLDAGLQGDYLDLIAALAPCVFGYGEIGLRLKAEASAGTPYQDWIDSYASDEYQQNCVETGQMIDAAVARRIGDSPKTALRWERVQSRFTKATELEVRFWAMGQRGA